MDDTLEIPRPRADVIQEGEDHSSGDEDAALDWTKLPKVGAAARPIIPKRGEKDFEPAPGGGSGLQLHVLDRSRNAMFEALRTNRTISSKTISYGIWYPSIDRVRVTTAHGIHFSTMGHSISRTAQYGNAAYALTGLSSKPPKRLELLPEEALYLIERGALFCYKSISSAIPLAGALNHEIHSPGAPMSVQQAFAEMIGHEDITLERYQVYAYLKRLGFILMRAEPPTPEYPVAPLPATQPQTLTRRFIGLFSHLISNVVGATRLFYRINLWKRLKLHQYKTTQDIIRTLRFIPCGHTIPLHPPPVKSVVSSKPSVSSPYKIFFHVYKPSTPFRKTAPPAPDFYIVVVDARTTVTPSLQELTALFGMLPEMPLPSPRKRNILASAKQPGDSQTTAIRSTTLNTVPQEGSSAKIMPSQPNTSWSSVIREFFQRLLSTFRMVPPTQRNKPTFTPPKPNPFPALKTGKKTIVVAAVDGGNISFFRFGQGVFEEWPMV